MKKLTAGYFIYQYIWKVIVWSCLIYINCVFTIDVKPQRERFTPDYHVYNNLTSIRTNVEKLVLNNKNLIRAEKKFLSKEGRNQFLLHMTNFSHYDRSRTLDRVKIFLSFGEHAREFLPVESCFNLIKSLLLPKTTQMSRLDSSYLNYIDLYVLVLGNPDGRQLVETKHNYCWRGTKSGVDINRNMDWEFGGKGSSGDAQDEEYRGKQPFSEPESEVYRQLPKLVKFDAFLSLHSGIKQIYIPYAEPESEVYRQLPKLVKFDAFLSLHSGIKQIYIPYADTKSRKTGREPANLQEMMSLAKQFSTATKYRYQYGKAAALNEYTADGTTFDYMAGIHKIPFSYAIELWGPVNHRGPSCFDLFNPPNDQLKTVIDNLIPLYKTLFDYLIKWKHPSYTTGRGKSEPSNPEPDRVNSVDTILEPNNSEVPSLTPGYTFLVLVVIVTILIGLYGRFPIFRRFYQRRRIVSLRSLGTTFSANIFSP